MYWYAKKILQQGFSETIRCVLDVFDPAETVATLSLQWYTRTRKTLTLLLEGNAKCSSTGRVG